MTVEIVGMITLIGAICIALISWFVATRRPATTYEEVRPGIYRTRRGYFFILTTILVIALIVTLQYTPYRQSRTEPVAMTLVANGIAWAWVMSDVDSAGPHPITVPVGEPVRFDVGALDVNHGFGVYRPDGKLLGQVQAMPGYRNRLTLTFPVAGTYRVFCLEYCGVGHHMMFSAIEAR